MTVGPSMIVPFVLLIASCLAIVWIFRAAVIGMQASMIGQGREIPCSFALGTVPYPAGDTFVLGLESSLWMVPAGQPRAGHGTKPASIRGIRFGRQEWLVRLTAIERRIDGRTRVTRGRLAITAQRVRFTGKTRTVDIPLADIAHFAVRGPLLEIQRRSAPTDAVAFRVPQPVLVARVIQSLTVRAARAARP